MGEDNALYTTNPVKDTKVYESGIVDLWNRNTPINATRIGDTTVVNGKRVMNDNKTFNTKPVEELSKKYANTKYETEDESAPYFYELENVDTGAIKYGIAPKGLEHRYAGQNMSQWKVNYNKRRTDAIELEALIHGNESMLGQKEVDLGFTKNTLMGKGASEIYTQGLSAVEQLLSPEQKQLTSKVLGTISQVDTSKQNILKDKVDDSYAKTGSNELSSKTLASSIPKEGSAINPQDYVNGLKGPKETIKDESQLYKDKDFVSKTRNVLSAFNVDIEGKTDKEVVDNILNETSNFDFNIADMAYIANNMQGKDKQVAKDWLDILETQDKTDLNSRQVKDAMQALFTDPTTYAAIGSFGASVPARMIGQSAIKQALASNVGKNATIGAMEGAAYNTVDNLFRQSIEQDAGLKKQFSPMESAQATSLGSLFGGGLGGTIGKALSGNETHLVNEELTKNVKSMPKEKNESIDKEKVEKSIKEEAIDSFVEKNLNIKDSEPKAETKIKQQIEDTLISKEQHKEEETPKLKSKYKKEVKTKSGNVVDSESALEGKKIVEDIEFEVSSPVEVRKPIGGNSYIPETSNPKKFELFYDDVGRMYTKDSSLLSYQGTPDQKAMLKQKEKATITNAEDEVSRRMEFYDKDSELRKRFGRTEAKFDSRVEIPKVKEEADRLRFMIEQYKDIKDNLNLSQNIRDDAIKRIDDIETNSKLNYNIPEEVVTKAEQRFIDENPIERPKDSGIRDKNLKTEFAVYKKNSTNKADYVVKPSRTIEEVVSNSMKEAKESRKDILAKIQKITIAERRSGNKNFTVTNITPEVRNKYKDDIADIEDFVGAREDIIQMQKKTMSPDEFMFRAKRRVDEQLKRENLNFKTIDEFDEFIERAIDKYDKAGVFVKRENITADFGKISGDGPVDPYKKMLREKKELDKAKKKNSVLQSHLKSYKRTRENPRAYSGKEALSYSQMRDVKDGILTFEEIANKTSPVTINAERAKAIKKARELAAEKSNETKRAKQGIKESYGLPKDITFKELVKDASNSVAQIISVLLGSKRLGSVSKLTGTDVDFRVQIGEVMAKNGMKLPAYPENLTWKDVVKPLVMTGNYGQMEKGLIENLMKAHKMSENEATKLFKAYEKASDSVVPELTEVKNKIYELYQATGKADLSWKLPNGFEVKISLSKEKDGTISIKDNEFKAKVKVDDFDEFSRAIMPRIIHSVDAYVASEMRRAGFPTVHDAFVIPKGKEQAAEDAYTKVMSEINDSNLLHDIMTSIGYTGKPLKIGGLTKEDIANSPHKLGVEHQAGRSEPSKARKLENSRQLSDEDIMRDYMASSNYRQIPTGRLIDALVNESGYSNTYTGVAREGDDVFERQMALAMQSPDYNPKLAIEAPKDVDAKMWNKVQREIFDESRAKLEDNPMLNGVIQGERKWFNEDGKIIGKESKTYNDILNEEIEMFNKLTYKIEETKPSVDLSKYKRERAKLMNNKAKFTLSDAIKRSNIDIARAEVRKSRWESFKTLWNEQIHNKGKYEQFNLLQKIKNVYKSEVDRDAEILYKDLKKIPKEKRDELMLLIKSDYEAIYGMTKKEGHKLLKDSAAIYNIAKAEIEQSAKGLGSQSEHYGAYMSNPHKIAMRYNLPKDAEPIIDQLISIRAMDKNKAWDVVEKYTDKDTDLKFIVDVMRTKRMLSEGELFASNPDKIVKGYFSEVYRGNKKINNDGTISWDADARYESGVLGSERENNKVGTKVDMKDYLKEYTDIEDIYVNYFNPKAWNIDKLNSKQQDAFNKLNMKYYLDERMTPRQTKYLGDLIKLGFDFENSPKGLKDKLAFMAKNRLKEGHDGFRKVTGEDIRIKAGKSNDLADVLTETVRSTNEKIKERGIIIRVLDNMATNESLLFSNTPKNGFVELTRDQLKHLPYSLAKNVKYVDSELVTKLVGRNEVRLYKGNNQHLKIADRLLANLGTAFKQNVVLKSPTSYINAFLVNHTISSMTGMNPKQMYKYQMQAMRDIKEMKELLEKLQRQKVSGQKLDAVMRAKLENNSLYRMEKYGGLSTNRVDGVVGDDDLLSSILEKHVPSPIFKLARTLNLNQKTAAGQMTLRTFSNIDTMGRYMVAQHYIDNGKSLNDACRLANGLFGDMDTMVPAAIELLDKYGLAPFLKWFTLTSPTLLKLTKDNPKKALALAVGIYVLGQETETNLASVNPLESVADFAEMTLPMGTYEDIQKAGLVDTFLKRAKSSIEPKYITNIRRSPETLGTKPLLKKRMHEPKGKDSLDYRGFTQQTIERIQK